MKKLLTVALATWVAAASAPAAAVDATGQFFINAGVGQAQYHVGRTSGSGYRIDDKDAAGSAHLGYLWRGANGFQVGVEGGYADLGTMKADLAFGSVPHAQVKAKGWLFGANGKYNVGERWYLQAQGGWFRSKTETKESFFDPFSQASSHASGSDEGDGWYGGVGIGYDLATDFSLGVNYVNYHARAKFAFATRNANIGTYTVTAEYRF